MKTLALPTEARELSKDNGLPIGLGQKLPIEFQYLSGRPPKPQQADDTLLTALPTNSLGWRAIENSRTTTVGNLVAGHSRPLLAVSMAFAGPLLSVIGVDGGGINFYGQSSRGKSTCGQAAASVWGKGASPGFVRSWRSTANALEGAAAVSTDTLLVLDELGVVDAREAVAGVYQLAAGTGKGRSTRDGSLRTSMTWRVMTLSTGELPMSAKVAEDRGRRARAGQQVRLLDIPADAGRGFYGSWNHVLDINTMGPFEVGVSDIGRSTRCFDLQDDGCKPSQECRNVEGLCARCRTFP